MKVVVLFDRFGPYHIARLEAAAKYLNVFAIEISGETSEYQWNRVESQKQINRTTLFENKETKEIPFKVVQEVLCKKLKSIQPDVVAINGWADRTALISLDWCLNNKVPAILMSESAEHDEERKFWKEWLKKQIVQKFSSALVGGSRHVSYLLRLKMQTKNIFLGYDVVDNDYFFRGANAAKQKSDYWRTEKKLPKEYFLVVSRFIEKKNLPFIINAYYEYVQKSGDNAWHLFIVGDGPLKEKLEKQTIELGLNTIVHFEGFKQYDELPIYFGLANALLHASTTEQWGLVVNEAMASALPVIISERCGCVPELVHTGKNGFSFNPHNQQELTSTLQSFSDGSVDVEGMGKKSLEIISEWNAETFGKGLLQAANAAITQLPKQHTVMSKIILRSLTRR